MTIDMKKYIRTAPKSIYQWVRQQISPVFIIMLIAAFVWWYITKLRDTYTTEHTVTIVVDGQSVPVNCKIRGKGTDLIGYTLLKSRSKFSIATNELSFDREREERDSTGLIKRYISPVSLEQVLEGRMNEVDVISVGAIPPIRTMGKPNVAPENRAKVSPEQIVDKGVGGVCVQDVVRRGASILGVNVADSVGSKEVTKPNVKVVNKPQTK